MLIFNGKSLSMPTNEQDFTTPLYLAAEKGHIELVKYLLSVGADKFKSDKVGVGDIGGLGTCSRQQSNEQNVMGGYIVLVYVCMYLVTFEIQPRCSTGLERGVSASRQALRTKNTVLRRCLFRKAMKR